MDRRQFLTTCSACGSLLLPELVMGETVNLQVSEDVQWELSENEYAGADRKRFSVAEQPYFTYLSTAAVDGEYRDSLGEVLKVVVPSLCNRTNLKEQLPVQITPTLYRVNLFTLGWLPYWSKIIQTYYPYYPLYLDRHKYIPLVIRADWFCTEVMDEVQTGEAQYLLLYEGKVPKNRDDFYKFWGVQPAIEYIYGMIEGQSGVAVNDPSGEHSVRMIENRPTSKRGYCWVTRDSEIIAGETDPFEVEQLAKTPEDIQHDASEYIVGMYKVLNGKEGCLQSYFLSEGNRIKKDRLGKIISQQTGKRQAKAPVEIVEDKTNTRGRFIRNSTSCIFCHLSGILPPTSSEYHKFIKADTQLFADPLKTKPELERYQGSDIQKYVKQNQEQYNDGVRLCSSFSGPEFSAAFTEVVRQHVGLVDLDGLAREMAIIYGPKVTREIMQKALAYGSTLNIINIRTAEIAEEGKLTRNMVLENFSRFQKVLDLWFAKPILKK